MDRNKRSDGHALGLASPHDAPVAVAVLPIWLSRRTRVARPYKALGLTVTGAFALLVLIGYTVPWAWTGFAGNSLWDWLELLALPIAVGLSPVFAELSASGSGRGRGG